jgi:hypothetical protein
MAKFKNEKPETKQEKKYSVSLCGLHPLTKKNTYEETEKKLSEKEFKELLKEENLDYKTVILGLQTGEKEFYLGGLFLLKIIAL